MKASQNVVLESHHVPPLGERERLQEYAVGIFRTIVSRKGIKKAIKRGRISVNSYKGETGDWIMGGERIDLLRGGSPKRPSILLDLEVLFEDDYLAVVNKPPGILVSGNKRYTLENGLSKLLKRSEEFDALTRPEPIHRLDYPTTGALLCGKTVRMVQTLNKKFEAREIQKTYLAVTYGKMSDSGIIEDIIDGKECRTEFHKLKEISSVRYTCLNLLEIRPITGRRHQIRRHLAGFGFPLFGDATYQPKDGQVAGKGLYLHARSLRFTHPVTGNKLKVDAPIPKKFLNLFPKL